MSLSPAQPYIKIILHPPVPLSRHQASRLVTCSISQRRKNLCAARQPPAVLKKASEGQRDRWHHFQKTAKAHEVESPVQTIVPKEQTGYHWGKITDSTLRTFRRHGIAYYVRDHCSLCCCLGEMECIYLFRFFCMAITRHLYPADFPPPSSFCGS